jgi:hypothetical protein
VREYRERRKEKERMKDNIRREREKRDVDKEGEREE